MLLCTLYPRGWGNVPSLIKVDEKDDVISEDSDAMGRWHGDDEGKHVINEGIEGL